MVTIGSMIRKAFDSTSSKAGAQASRARATGRQQAAARQTAATQAGRRAGRSPGARGNIAGGYGR